jgi:hypothetical protein
MKKYAVVFQSKHWIHTNYISEVDRLIKEKNVSDVFDYKGYPLVENKNLTKYGIFCLKNKARY